MSAPKIVSFFCYDGTNTPKTGLTPVFLTYKDDTGAGVTPPAITEIGGGAYKFIPTFTTGRAILYCINPGTNITPVRLSGMVRPEDFGVDTLLQIGVGSWEIKTTGVNANQMLFYDTDGVTILYKFNLTDVSGTPTTTGVFKRTPV